MADDYLSELEEQMTGVQGFRFLSAGELCGAPRPTRWLIERYLNEGALACVFGESGAMKSFLAIEAGLCVATGRSWHGFTVKTQGSVFYICGEGFSGISKRLKAWSIHRGVDLAAVPFFVSDRPARLLDEAGIEEIVKAIDALVDVHGKPVLVVVDTLNRNFGPGDENSTADMTRFVSALDDVRTRYGCATLIVHHSGLSSSDRARGASALRASLDWEFRMSKESSGHRTLTCTKSKDHAEPAPLSFEPVEVLLDDWLEEDGQMMTSCVLTETEPSHQDAKPLRGARRIAYDALVAAVGKGESVSIEVWRDAAYAAGISPSSSQDAKQKAFRRAVTDLLDVGLVVTKNDYWWPDTGQNSDMTGQCPGASTRTDTDTTP